MMIEFEHLIMSVPVLLLAATAPLLLSFLRRHRVTLKDHQTHTNDVLRVSRQLQAWDNRGRAQPLTVLRKKTQMHSTRDNTYKDSCQPVDLTRLNR